MVLKYHISPYPASTEDWVLKIWEAASDGSGAEIYTQNIAQPHTGTTTITVNGLDKVVHIVRLYGATSLALLHEYNAEPLADVIELFSPIYFKIGDGGTYTPASGSNEYTNPLLQDLGDDDYTVFRNNYGYLFPNTHYTTDAANAKWVLDGADVFNDEEEFVILRKPKAVEQIVNDSVVGKWFGGFVDISANTDYDAAHLRKLLRFTSNVTYTFPVSTSVPVGYGFVFQHFANTASAAKVKFDNGTLLWAGSPKSEIDLPQYSEACFVWDGTNWNVVYLCESNYVNGGTGPQPGDIIAAGQLFIGDVPSGDIIYTITHNQNVSGDYLVFTSIKSNNAATHYKNNKMGQAWHHDATNKPNKFHVSLQEISGETQDLSLAWVMIKI